MNVGSIFISSAENEGGSVTEYYINTNNPIFKKELEKEKVYFITNNEEEEYKMAVKIYNSIVRTINNIISNIK